MEEELIEIKFYLEAATKFGLELEVIHESLMNMKYNSNLTAGEAMRLACVSWDVLK